MSSSFRSISYEHLALPDTPRLPSFSRSLPNARSGDFGTCSLLNARNIIASRISCMACLKKRCYRSVAAFIQS
jgi:hypothetical protein